MKVIALLWIGLMSFLLICFPVQAADPPLPFPIGRVVWVKGTLTATMKNAEKRILQKTSVIYLQDTLSTAVASQAQVVFSDDSLMTFRENTQFTVEKFKGTLAKKGKTGGTGQFVGNLIQGGFRTVTGVVAKQAPDNYQVKTPVATIGVRGTDYDLFVQPDGQTIIGQNKGTPCISCILLPKQKTCLDNNHRYAKVVNASTPPILLDKEPEVFKEKLVIIPATITPFDNNNGPGPSKSGGTTDSFCITQ